MTQPKIQGVDPPRLRRAYFECRHGQLHVHNAIPVGGGFDELTTLLCLHGAAGTGRLFLELSRRLGRTRSVYSPDLPGCGESDGAPARLSVIAYAEAVGDFLDSMRFRQVDLLGAGAGAAVAVELAMMKAKMVRRVALVGATARETPLGGGGNALQAAAQNWQPERLQLLKQPSTRLDQEVAAALDSESLALKLAEFFAG